MMKFFFALFILVPLAELYVLIEVGSGIGGLATIALCLLTAAIGGLLIRWQGMSTLLDAQKRMAQGEIPAEHGFHGVMIALSGILLFTPGFITDSVGFLLLIPPVRTLIIHRLLPINRIDTARDSGIIDIEIIHEDKHLR